MTFAVPICAGLHWYAPESDFLARQMVRVLMEVPSARCSAGLTYVAQGFRKIKRGFFKR